LLQPSSPRRGDAGNYTQARGTNLPIMKNKNTFAKMIEKEIEALNVKIDKKIIKGLPYIAEGKKHAALLKLLNEYA
jgi:hypothetical protein